MGEIGRSGLRTRDISADEEHINMAMSSPDLADKLKQDALDRYLATLGLGCISVLSGQWNVWIDRR